MKNRIVLLPAIMVTCLSLLGVRFIVPATGQIDEQTLGPIPEDRLHECVTQGAQHIAWIVQRGSKACVT